MGAGRIQPLSYSLHVSEQTPRVRPLPSGIFQHVLIAGVRVHLRTSELALHCLHDRDKETCVDTAAPLPKLSMYPNTRRKPLCKVSRGRVFLRLRINPNTSVITGKILVLVYGYREQSLLSLAMFAASTLLAGIGGIQPLAEPLPALIPWP